MTNTNSAAFNQSASVFDATNSTITPSSPLTNDLHKYAIASRNFTDNAGGNFAGDLNNPFDDARIAANEGLTINQWPTVSGFGAPIVVGSGATVSDAVRQRWKVENLAQPLAIDIPAYVEPTVGAFDRTFDVGQLPLNGAADVAQAFGDSGFPLVVRFTGGSLALPSDTVLRNLTIVVERGDLNFNGDGHLLENVTIVVKNGAVNLGDVRSVNSSVYADGIRMNQGARFSGKNLLMSEGGDVVFNGATETIDPKDFVKVVAQGDIFLNAAADTRGEFWSSGDFLANQASTIVGKIRAEHNITFNAQVRVISDVLLNLDFPVKNQPTIAIIDTGFAKNNPDINYQRLTSLVDRVGGDNDSFLAIGEGNEHGTHTLGIIAAIQDNDFGINGVNANAPIYVARSIGSGQWAESIVEFLDQYEVNSNQPNPIIYLGFDLTQQNADGSMTTRYELTVEERSALEYARQKGALIVVPAGNDGGVMSALGQAAQEFDNIVTVGALDATGRAPYSSYGDGLTIMAPGGTVDQPIVSTVGDGLGTMAGTSTAAAYAVGYIANIWAANPALSYKQVIDILKETARDINLSGWDAETGFGILDVASAIELAQQTEPEIYDPPATVVPETWTGEGKVVPLERAVGQAVLVNWSSKVSASVTIGAFLRPEAGTEKTDLSYKPQGTVKAGTPLKFDAWKNGEEVDYSETSLKRKDDRWYRISSDASVPVDYRGKWISATLIDGEPPTSEGPKPSVTVPIVTGSPNYLNGQINPFAYRWVGQCTWYAYGRMLETGLLPVSAKANGWFLGNAEAWRRDALRAGLKVNSQPTGKGLVVWPPGVQGGHRLYGHVAFVEEVFADGRIRISESNWNGKQVGERILTPAQYKGLAFIPLENITANPQFSSPSAKSGQHREYRVRSGDTLSGIALRELGDANRWREIKKADGKAFTEVEARQLQIGNSVYLPIIYRPSPVDLLPPNPSPRPVPTPQPKTPDISEQLSQILRDYQVQDDKKVTWSPYLIGAEVTTTETEKKMLDRLWPWDQYAFAEIKDKAFSESESIFSFTGNVPEYVPKDEDGKKDYWISNDGHRDAFRHSYWNILLTKKFGISWTQRFTTAHEALPGNQIVREAMDLYNNEVGRKIASENSTADDAQLSSLLKTAIDDGKLIVINQLGQISWSNQVAVWQHGIANPQTGGGGQPVPNPYA
jgi:surface antigen